MIKIHRNQNKTGKLVILLGLLIFLSQTIVSAQDTIINYNYFFHEYENLNENQSFFTCIPVDSNYLIVGSRFTTEGKFLTLTKIDGFGNIVDTHTLYEGEDYLGFSRRRNYIKTSDNNIIIVYSKLLPDQISMELSRDLFLMKFTPEGTILWDKKILGTSCEDECFSLSTTSDGGLIMAGKRVCGSNRMLLIKADSLGNHEWDKTYITDYNSTSTSAHERPNGDFMIGGGQRIDPVINDNENWIVKINSTGDIIDEYLFGGPYFDKGAWLFPLDSIGLHYLILSQEGLEESTTFPSQLRWTKIDSSFNIIWDHSGSPIPKAYLWATFPVIFSDGSFVCFQAVRNQYFLYDMYFSRYDADGNLVFIQDKPLPNPDPMQGDIVWGDLQATADGGFLFTGYQHYPSPQKGFVVKLDSLGNTCSYVGCDSLVYTVELDTMVGFTQVENTEFASLLSNPIENSFAQLFYYSTKPAIWLVYDLQGNLLKEELLSSSEKSANLYLGDLPRGLYLYQVRQGAHLLGEGKLVK